MFLIAILNPTYAPKERNLSGLEEEGSCRWNELERKTTIAVVAGHLSSPSAVVCFTATGSTLATHKRKFAARFRSLVVQEKDAS